MNPPRGPRIDVSARTLGEKAYRAIATVLFVAIGIGIAVHSRKSGSEALYVAASTDTITLREALKRYKIDNGRFPTEAEGLAALIDSKKQYLDRLPTDPWGQRYSYAHPGKRQEIEVSSFGPDGKPGTDDDIGSWQK